MKGLIGARASRVQVERRRSACAPPPPPPPPPSPVLSRETKPTEEPKKNNRVEEIFEDEEENETFSLAAEAFEARKSGKRETEWSCAPPRTMRMKSWSLDTTARTSYSSALSRS